MSQEMNRGEEVSFGERLLGMEGFNAQRAQRYRGAILRRKASVKYGTIFLALGYSLRRVCDPKI